MSLNFLNNWDFFLICFADLLITSAIMSAKSRSFFTMGTTKKAFSMFDLEFPSSTFSTEHLLLNIDKLGPEAAAKAKRALRGQLYVDFLFMPGTYLGILFLCHKASLKAGCVGSIIFLVLGALQLLCWLCDIVENCILFSFIKRPRPYNDAGFKAWTIMEAIKWGGSLIGFFSASSALTYFWITGNYHEKTVCSLSILIVGTVAILFIASKFTKKRKAA